MRRRSLRVLLSVIVATTSLALGTDEVAAGPCYWGSPTYRAEAVSNPEWGITGYSLVDYKLGYTCTGQLTDIKIVHTKFVYRATVPHPQAPGIQRIIEGHSIYQNFNGGNPIGPYWVWDTGSQRKTCYGVCSMAVENWPNVVMRVASTNVHYITCIRCSNIAGRVMYKFWHYFRTNQGLVTQPVIGCGYNDC